MTDQEFHEFRRKGIGGSEVAAILGCSPYRKPIDVWKEKVLDYRPEIGYAQQRAMKQGTAMENHILLWGGLPSYARKNLQIALPVLQGNIDSMWGGGLIHSQIVMMEAKTESIKNREKYGEENSFDIPIHYQLQVLHYAYLVQEKYHPSKVIIKVPVYFVDRSKEIDDENFVIERVMYGKVFSAEDRIKTKHVNSQLIHFWEEYILPKKMPTNYWNKTSVETDHIDVKTISRLKETRNEIKTLKGVEKDLLGCLGGKYTAQILFNPLDKDEVLIERHVINSQRLDTKRLKKENKAIYDDYTKESTQIRWTFPKEKHVF